MALDNVAVDIGIYYIDMNPHLSKESSKYVSGQGSQGVWFKISDYLPFMVWKQNLDPASPSRLFLHHQNTARVTLNV